MGYQFDSPNVNPHSPKAACLCKPRDVVVTVRNGNYSAFNGYHFTPSDYSEVMCLKCGWRWRTKAQWVHSTPGCLPGQGD